MFFFKGKKEHERYYLLPGMGKSAARRKRMKYLKWAIVFALMLSAVLAVLLYWLDRR
jgi:hypothetical protein